jgi:hypothetical protein
LELAQVDLVGWLSNPVVFFLLFIAGRAGWGSFEEMASRACKIAVLVAVLAILALLELRTVEAQGTIFLSYIWSFCS